MATNEELQAINAKITSELVKCTLKQEGYLSLFKAACFERNGELAAQYRQELEANMSIMLDHHASVMTNIAMMRY